MTKVLEVNVDDKDSGGVYALVRNVIINNKSDVKIDIASIEKFEKQSNIDALKEHNCDVFYVGYTGQKFKKQIEVYKNLKKLVKDNKYEYVHIHADTSNKLLVSGLAAKSGNVPNIILHSHSAGIDGNHRKMKKFIHLLFRPFLKYVGTKFVSCSDYAAKWMFPNVKNVTIINNGVDLDRFKYSEVIREKVRSELRCKDELLIGHVGRFLYQKNHEYLMLIMEEIAKRGIDARLLLVGEGELQQDIKNMVKEKGLEKQVIFYGLSNRVNELMQAMDVFLFPSHFEGLPIVGVEAQASGLPVIFSDKITREGKLTDDVTYLPIEKSTVDMWIKNIEKFKDKKTDRESVYLQLKEKKFDIRDTVDSFLGLYKG